LECRWFFSPFPSLFPPLSFFSHRCLLERLFSRFSLGDPKSNPTWSKTVEISSGPFFPPFPLFLPPLPPFRLLKHVGSPPRVRFHGLYLAIRRRRERRLTLHVLFSPPFPFPPLSPLPAPAFDQSPSRLGCEEVSFGLAGFFCPPPSPPFCYLIYPGAVHLVLFGGTLSGARPKRVTPPLFSSFFPPRFFRSIV